MKIRNTIQVVIETEHTNPEQAIKNMFALMRDAAEIGDGDDHTATIIITQFDDGNGWVDATREMNRTHQH